MHNIPRLGNRRRWRLPVVILTPELEAEGLFKIRTTCWQLENWLTTCKLENCSLHTVLSQISLTPREVWTLLKNLSCSAPVAIIIFRPYYIPLIFFIVYNCTLILCTCSRILLMGRHGRFCSYFSSKLRGSSSKLKGKKDNISSCSYLFTSMICFSHTMCFI